MPEKHNYCGRKFCFLDARNSYKQIKFKIFWPSKRIFPRFPLEEKQYKILGCFNSLSARKAAYCGVFVFVHCPKRMDRLENINCIVLVVIWFPYHLN